MALGREPITTTPHSPSHLRVVIDRLRRQAGATTGVIFPDEGTAASALAVGEVVYAPSAGNLDLAIATALSTSRVVGIVVQAADSGAIAIIQTAGVVENAGWSLTANTVYYLSKDTPGALTATGPDATGETVVAVGIAISATQLMLLITPPILL